MSNQSFLDSLYIASPCNANWNDMNGNERVRMCSLCSKNVYNTSDMTKTEAEGFLRKNGVSECVGFFRRSDGTIMTDDCPIALRKIRNSLKMVSRAMASAVALLLYSGVGSVSKVTGEPANCHLSEVVEKDEAVKVLPTMRFGGGGNTYARSHVLPPKHYVLGSIPDACAHSESVLIAKYQQCVSADKQSLSDSRRAKFKVVQILKGPIIDGDVEIKYEAHDLEVIQKPSGWRFFEKQLPRIGDSYILCVEHLTSNKTSLDTYQGANGIFPVSPGNLEAFASALGRSRADAPLVD
jgi:hypothetical protein